MTQDFRQPSPKSIGADTPDTRAAVPGSGQPDAAQGRCPPPAPAARALILSMLGLWAGVFVLGGIAVLVLEPEFLPAEVRPILGFALIVLGISDWIAARFLRRLWRR